LHEKIRFGPGDQENPWKTLTILNVLMLSKVSKNCIWRSTIAGLRMFAGQGIKENSSQNKGD